MYCPKCAAENDESANYCRKCGRDLTLVSQAMTGRLPVAAPSNLERARRRRRTPTLHGGIRRLFSGITFLAVAIALVATGEHWALWLLFPAFTLIGRGVAALVSVKYSQSERDPRPLTAKQAGRTQEIGPRAFSDGTPAPPSVTEGTTRIIEPHLNVIDRETESPQERAKVS